MLGGPPFYLGGFRVEVAQLEQGLQQFGAHRRGGAAGDFEHHALRDEAWKQKAAPVYEQASEAGQEW